MPKILVADDNSNIQKMVGLALKDQGIDVVAVGNGEAAVRKIADVRPDLVLADVFMPVRNGYEVCQFVKMDSALSHIPVILLVGAFDPLDEQEAQRVGADGVLKKPFIPPDPLISMVKSALQRSGSSPVSATPAVKFDEPAAFGAKEMLSPGNASVPVVTAMPNPVQPVQEFNLGSSPEAMSESFVEDVPARPEPLKIDSGSQPVAFGSLLETPGEKTETAEDDSTFTTANSPEFAMEHDWRDRDEEPMDAEEEEEGEPAAWRPEGTADAEEVPAAAKAKKPKSSANDWRTGGFEAVSKSRSMGWEPEEETPAPVPVETVAPAASTRAPEKPATPPPTPIQPMQPAQPMPVKPIQEVTPAPSAPFVTETWTPPAAPVVPPAPVMPAAPVAPPTVSETRVTETATAVVDEKPKAESEAKPAPEKPDKKDGKDSWFSVSSSPWEGEIQKASQLASTWDAPTVPVPKNGSEKAVEASEETQTVIEEAALPPMAIEAIREEAAQVAEDATFILETPESASAEGGSFYAREEEGVLESNGAQAQAPSPAPASTSSPSMDDLVAKVLAKMNPEVLQAVTREILKPVVEAMVKEELKSKKS